MERSLRHDRSKLEEPERSIFDEFTPKLKDCTYGSDEYKGYLKEMQGALDFHYGQNRHHPEFHHDGIDGMTLIDLLEMLMDWKATSERHANGDINRSIFVNQERFRYDEQLKRVLTNTVEWLKTVGE